ncbi:MAG: aminotransferase class V-fold PLP-dependent enzyme [Oscillospiraceae bacterium]|nr:aminotransferase class V-fold PLP-dependent enzyme [Oscillospiraceae bacterium]
MKLVGSAVRKFRLGLLTGICGMSLMEFIGDFLDGYTKRCTARFHMPGHKGCGFAHDITEIAGAGNLYSDEGIVALSEQVTAGLYGVARTFFSAGGSTLCIQTMLLFVKRMGRRVVAVRNVHKAFVNAAALLDLDVCWFMPDYNTHISGEIDLVKLKAQMREGDCLYVTSPDYLGKIADIKALSDICHEFNALLLVDSAHGAHLAFMPENLHPIHLGADLCCDSAHKMLPVLTGGAFLHTNENYDLKADMEVFGSSSPSYLILESLDKCNTYIKEKIRSDIAVRLAIIAELKRKLPKYNFYGDDPFHITLMGIDGLSFARQLDSYGIVCEYADEFCILFLASPVTPFEDFIRLRKALELLEPCPSAAEYKPPSLPEKKMSMHEALLGQQIPEDRICRRVSVTCPPCVPTVMPGEKFP